MHLCDIGRIYQCCKTGGLFNGCVQKALKAVLMCLGQLFAGSHETESEGEKYLTPSIKKERWKERIVNLVLRNAVQETL